MPTAVPPDRRADEAFLRALIEYFGEEPFERGNLDGGRLSWLFEREVVPAQDDFDPESYVALLRVDLKKAQASFPQIFRRRVVGVNLLGLIGCFARLCAQCVGRAGSSLGLGSCARHNSGCETFQNPLHWFWKHIDPFFP